MRSLPSAAVAAATALTIAAGHHHHHHYASVDLIGLGIGAAASWAGVPGPGEPLLIAAGILAARPGPLLKLRLRALERGERIFARATVVAVLLAPSWLIGIHGVGFAIFVPLNVLGAALWALAYGLGAYFAGPPLVDLLEDAGTATLVAVIGWLHATVSGRASESTGRARPHATTSCPDDRSGDPR
jgi:membrane protein DedA with SNARE-associated domain